MTKPTPVAFYRPTLRPVSRQTVRARSCISRAQSPDRKWEGPKLGPDDPGIAAKTGFAAVRNYSQLAADLEAAAKLWPSIYTIPAPRKEDGYPHFTVANEWIKASHVPAPPSRTPLPLSTHFAR